MSPEAWIGAITLVLTALGVLLGAAWWMSALYSRVGHIQHNTKATNVKIDTLTDKMDGELHDVRTVQRVLQKDVNDLQIRMVRVEDAIDTERE